MGTIRINGSQIETKVEYATVSLGLSTNVDDVLKEAVKQFAAQVTKKFLRYLCHKSEEFESCVFLWVE